MILWTLWKIYFFGKSFRESWNPKGFVKNTPYLSNFIITGKDTMFRLGLSWNLHDLLCLWKLEIYRKTRKKGKILLTNSYFGKTDSSQSSTFKSSQHISCYWIKTGFFTARMAFNNGKSKPRDHNHNHRSDKYYITNRIKIRTLENCKNIPQKSFSNKFT